MIQKLTPDEIKSRQDAATGYWQSAKALELELEAAKRNVKVLKAQIAEANRNFDTLMGEISSGEVEVDGQGRLV